MNCAKWETLATIQVLVHEAKVLKRSSRVVCFVRVYDQESRRWLHLLVQLIEQDILTHEEFGHVAGIHFQKVVRAAVRERIVHRNADAPPCKPSLPKELNVRDFRFKDLSDPLLIGAREIAGLDGHLHA